MHFDLDEVSVKMFIKWGQSSSILFRWWLSRNLQVCQIPSAALFPQKKPPSNLLDKKQRKIPLNHDAKGCDTISNSWKRPLLNTFSQLWIIIFENFWFTIFGSFSLKGMSLRFLRFSSLPVKLVPWFTYAKHRWSQQEFHAKTRDSFNPLKRFKEYLK